MKTKLLKQYHIPRVGAIVDSLYTSLPILSIINFLSILTVLYATTREYLDIWAPWLTFWMFVGFLGSLTLLTMIVIYKFVLPSVWTFRQKQMFGYESQIIDELKALKEEIRQLSEKAALKEKEEK